MYFYLLRGSVAKKRGDTNIALLLFICGLAENYVHFSIT